MAKDQLNPLYAYFFETIAIQIRYSYIYVESSRTGTERLSPDVGCSFDEEGGWPERSDERHHLTTFNTGCSGVSKKSIVCLNRSLFTNAAYAFSVVLTEA